MRILAPTHIHPSRHHVRTAAFSNVFAELRKRCPLEVTWAFFQPEPSTDVDYDGDHIADIHACPDAVSLLERCMPDGVLVTGTDDIIQRSFCIAARHLGIPVFSVLLFGASDGHRARRTASAIFNTLLSDRISTDTAGQSRPLRRARFTAYKSRFMLETLRHSGAGFMGSLATVLKHVILDVSGRISRCTPLADWYFAVDGSWVPVLEEMGKPGGRIHVTGSPYWNGLARIQPPRPAKTPDEPAKVLVLTDSLMTHNYWTKRQSDQFIVGLISELSADPALSITVKIHPASEDIAYYERLLEGRGIPVLQREELGDIINNHDIAVTFGASTAQTRVLASGTRMVVVETGIGLYTPPLVPEGTESGLLSRCRPGEAAGAVRGLLASTVHVSPSLETASKAIFSGKNTPASRIAAVIASRLSGSIDGTPAINADTISRCGTKTPGPAG